MNYWSRLLGAVFAILLVGCQPLIVPPEATPVAPAPTVSTPAATQPSQEIVDQLYQDPQGRFTVPIPTNWTAQMVDDYAVLSSPQDQIHVYIVTVPGEDVEAALTEAWNAIDPTFALAVANVAEVPLQTGAERTLLVTYDAGAQSDEYVQAVGLLYEGVVYALLVRGELVALEQRAAQINIILTGFTIAGIEEIDLAGVEPLPVDETIIAQLESYINDALVQFGIPGAAVSIVQGDDLVYAEGFGIQALGSDEPVTPETLFMIGSTGKTMTTMMMATLVDDGLMDWDTPVVEVLPQFAVADPVLTEQITMRNLVCACTGVPRRDLELFFDADGKTAEDVIESLETFEFFTDFGEAFQYSNQLVATAGYAAAAAAGGEYGNLYDRYVEEMNERVFEPTGMVSTTIPFTEVTATDNYALPHYVTPDFTYAELSLELERFVIPVAPAGAPWSNVLDMGRYLITELNAGVAPDGTRIVSAAALATTWEPQIGVTAQASYGLGWFVDEYKGQLLLHHGGNTVGFTSDLAFLPEADLGISILTNGGMSNFFNEAVRQRLFELVFAQESEAAAQAELLYTYRRNEILGSLENLQEIDPATVEPYLGRYTNPALGEIELRLEDGSFLLDAGRFATELRAQPDETGAIESYVTYSPPFIGLPVQLAENEAGETTVVLGTGTTEYEFTPVE